ncbi:MAG: SPFH domain-containing protein [Bacteroidaceae bacterium]|nr:SPFH domain-containing protein [Bacteroidaceae bacterium]
MENKEFTYQGTTLNGFAMLFLNLALTIGAIVLFVLTINYESWQIGVASGLMLLISLFLWGGFIMLEPGEARVVMFFGKYVGTFTRTGYYWINLFTTTKTLSLRARNLDAEPIKVNDKEGNPVMIGLVLVWRLKDTYKALFEIDSQTMAASGGAQTTGMNVKSMMAAFERFVRVQSDAALRQVAGQYAYDDTESRSADITLRSGGEEINDQLEQKLTERLSMAGIEVVEARINYLAYAPEIAAVMLRRQQATAIIAAREKIVEGAVSMVKMALDQLSAQDIVHLDDDRKAQMVSNLLVVLCGEDNAQPIVNTGSI